jgi:ABC-type polar amino acid transport system ATPase subunit
VSSPSDASSDTSSDASSEVSPDASSGASPRAVIALSGVSKWYGRLQVLREVSLALLPHEKLVICGPSGSGKSTLLRVIDGLEPHDAGRIEVDGTELCSRTADAIRRNVGMVFQSFNLFPHMTALENCTLAPVATRRATAEQARTLAQQYLERVHLAHRAHHYPAQLSGGEQQRVAIARALCLGPKVMLFDEPTSALDPLMVKEVLDIILELATCGLSMICVTHELAFARRLADRMIFMDGGEVIEQADPAAFFESPRSERLRSFLGRMPAV